ncbi:MAG: capsular polysaccharide export protein [Paracoccaceae bacterium]|jgi:capsular polysaccharide export protein
MRNRRTHAFTGGFLRDKRVQRILELSGYYIRLGLPAKNAGLVAEWGRKPRTWRAKAVAKWRGAELINVEDGFLRSVLTGRSGAPPQSLVIDTKGVYFDCTCPSDLEDILNFAKLSTPELTVRAAAGMARLAQSGLSKYNGFDPSLKVGESGYVLVIDQTRADASIRFGGADESSFAHMLTIARRENPGSRILIKSHPEVVSRYRQGHFSDADLDENTRLLREPYAPRHLLDGASKVYCVTSLMGFEAILAGHRPRVFGRPFYGGWGLSDDEQTFERRSRSLTCGELFTAVLLIYPKHYDVYRDCLCSFETIVDNLEAQSRAWSEDCHGYVALGIRMWKRGHFRRFFKGSGARLSYANEVAPALRTTRRGLIWATKETDQVRAAFDKVNHTLLRLEDGFLRSKGLGAELVPPLSLVVDDLGIYYDPTRESRLERLLNDSDTLDQGQLDRATKLRERLVRAGLSKYNVGQTPAAKAWPKGLRILVPGQVEDDASILLGAGKVATNLDLLVQTRTENPDAFIAYKPHPDVEAGLRKGQLDEATAGKYADEILNNIDADAAIMMCDEIWTMTSLLGFEALLRDKKVTCYGAPFYAGWGLTKDLNAPVERRQSKPSIDALVHAALIDYPRYFDPKSGLPCPVEVVLERLEQGAFRRATGNRMLSKLQGVFASFAPFWR